MKYRVTAKCFDLDYDTKNTLLFDVESPNTCPRCNLAWQPFYAYALYTQTDDSYHRYTVDVLWLCPSCRETSISRYRATDNLYTHLEYSFPQEYNKITFYKGIEDLSPLFVKIYNEAVIAEYNNLFEIAGIGYRKALEFLVKDYAIARNPNDKEKIEDMALAKCVVTYISNPRISAIVERTVWIGNDQTHYKKKHVDRGLEDLKILLDLSVSYITMELQAEEAMKIQKIK